METNFLSKRLSYLYNLLKSSGCDVLYLTSQLASKFFADFHGSSSFIIVSEKSLLFITDGRYRNEAASLNPLFTTSIYSESIVEHIKKENLFGGMKIGIEGDDINFSSFLQLKNIFPSKNFKNISSFLSPICSIHDDESIKRIKKAIQISKKVYKHIRKNLIEGITELDLAAEVSYITKKYGADGDAFSPIILFGERTSLPHGKPSKRKLKNNNVVLIDIGSVVKGVCCDFTRTLVFGRMNQEQKKIFSIVKKAKEIGIEKAVKNKSCKSIDLSVRNYIMQKGFADYFVHATGHGLGYNVHLYPRISSASQHILKNNFIITIEPGIYIPGLFGVRFEDDILIQDGSPVNLTNFN